MPEAPAPSTAVEDLARWIPERVLARRLTTWATGDAAKVASDLRRLPPWLSVVLRSLGPRLAPTAIAVGSDPAYPELAVLAVRAAEEGEAFVDAYLQRVAELFPEARVQRRLLGGRESWCHDFLPASPLHVCVAARGEAALLATSDEFAHITAALAGTAEMDGD
jgi:hypothetical protein